MEWRIPIIVHNESVMDKWAPVEMAWDETKNHINRKLASKGFAEIDRYELSLLVDETPIPYQIDRFWPHNSQLDLFVFRAEVEAKKSRTYFLMGRERPTPSNGGLEGGQQYTSHPKRNCGLRVSPR